LKQEQVLARIDELLKMGKAPGEPSDLDGPRVGEMYQGTLQLARIVYGTGSAQERSMLAAYESLKYKHSGDLRGQVEPIVLGALRSMKAEIELGLLVSQASLGMGEALADFAALAREALAAGAPQSTNVAAVLAAALFEDTVRPMGAILASVRGRPKLEAVLASLKDAGVFQGASHTVALGYLKFRNDALHAD